TLGYNLNDSLFFSKRVIIEKLPVDKL
mgnify:CR=1